MSAKVAAVFGVGPGLGGAVHDAIAAAGGTAFMIPTDTTDPASVAAAFTTMRGAAGDPEVLVYNAGAFEMGGIAELTPASFEQCWRANCFGAFLAAREAAPAMAARKRGTMIFTGATASLRGRARVAGPAGGKFGPRALAQSLARELGPQGVHVAHVIIDGRIGPPDRTADVLLAP